MESMVINGIIDLAGAFVCPYDAPLSAIENEGLSLLPKINCGPVVGS